MDKPKTILENHDDNQEIKPKWYSGPLKFIIALFLLLIVIMWAASYYAVKLNPEPDKIPSIGEVLPKDAIVPISPMVLDLKHYVTPLDQTIKETATKVASLSCDGNKVCQAKAIYYFVRDNIDYVADPVGKEYFESGIEVMKSGGGDCESGAMLLASLYESIGIDTQIVVIKGHAYDRIKLPEASKRYKTDGDWVFLDWTCKSCTFGEVPWSDIRSDASYIEVP